MYRLRQMELDDKACEQVDLALLEQVYPRATLERCVGESAPWSQKERRVRQSTLVSLVWFVLGLALWSRLAQDLVWEKLVGKLCDLHPTGGGSAMSASALSGRRQELGSAGLAQVVEECCVELATREGMPTAFFGRYRIMAVDGTLFNTPDTPANDAAFGRSSNQYGPGAYPQVRATLLAECGSHAVVGLDLSGYGESEVHGAQRLLQTLGPDTLLLADANIISGGLLERARRRKVHVLGALEAGVWEHLPQRRLCDGSVLVWVPPSRPGQAHYAVEQGVWVRILSYRLTDARLGEPGQVYRLVTTLLNPRTAPALALINLYHERWEIELVLDEVKTHERQQRKVLRSKTPEGVRQELYGLFLVHYAVRVQLAQAAERVQEDPDRLSFTQGLFYLVEAIDLSTILQPASSITPLVERMQEKMARHLLPERQLRINRREVKQVYNKFKPKKRNVPPPAPFAPGEQFLDFVVLVEPVAAAGGT